MKYKFLLFDKNNSPLTQVLTKPLSEWHLNEGEILIRAKYSGINYKDALGVLNKSPIFKINPIVPGIDCSGEVIKSRSKKFKVGAKVIAHGMSLGEEKDGGYSELVKVHENSTLWLPERMTYKQAMVLGTAGFTAALAIDRMITNGQTFDKGPILVSGATGGVGSFAVQILSQLGFFVEATTSRPEEFASYLEALGAHYVSPLGEVIEKRTPLAKATWGGAIDNLGGEFLESILPSIELWGNVASIGLAQGAKFSTTVMPFILRGVSLLGASSNNCTMEKRQELWNRLALEWRPNKIEELVTKTVTLEEIPKACEQILNHQNHGRVLVTLED